MELLPLFSLLLALINFSWHVVNINLKKMPKLEISLESVNNRKELVLRNTGEREGILQFIKINSEINRGRYPKFDYRDENILLIPLKRKIIPLLIELPEVNEEYEIHFQFQIKAPFIKILGKTIVTRKINLFNYVVVPPSSD